ncbi:cytidylate kinase [Mesomycoplasma conjunctivae]|uniref:Cytidylate kinase n=1 Tax=Mesomycoplasma conjunctivae (strain ATCC 25834 / NCTC 10147 / HRC/581) TaxID=572263 RepID=C5J630_MESCH|nr:(d)CMP kinase [Mesomycoplasma conjunctivae]CAT04922.1 Cytidylate kinase [Mesomycoplasma conjunctivae]VEU66053.1 cytidylate kinase [Mesomycoplasma conjunctivae]
MTKKINIAIDGPSGAGKSTIAKIIADKYGYIFVNTGSLYRAITYYFLSQKINVHDEKLVSKSWDNSKLVLLENGDVILEGNNITKLLRKDEISQKSAIIAKYNNIRNSVTQILHDFQTKHKGVIMEGRDTTYVLMPNAELKIFLWADSEVRAQRRVKQNLELNLETNFNLVLKDIEKRDFIDSNRKINPLQKTFDSIFLDSTVLSQEEVIQQISKLIESKIGK